MSGHHCFYPDAASALDFHSLALQKQWFLMSHQVMSDDQGFYPDAVSAPDFNSFALQKQWFLKSHQVMCFQWAFCVLPMGSKESYVFAVPGIGDQGIVGICNAKSARLSDIRKQLFL